MNKYNFRECVLNFAIGGEITVKTYEQYEFCKSQEDEENRIVSIRFIIPFEV